MKNRELITYLQKIDEDADVKIRFETCDAKGFPYSVDANVSSVTWEVSYKNPEGFYKIQITSTAYITGIEA